MAQKKEVRSDNTYLITEESTANPKLGALRRYAMSASKKPKR